MKKYEDMNEYDKIILEHQFALNVDCEKRKEEHEKHLQDTPEHLQIKKHFQNPKLRYMAFEDTKNKLWLFYDSETSQYLTLPFGQIAIDILNTFKIYNPDNPQYEKYISKNINQDNIDTNILKGVKDTALYCKDKIDYLFLFLSQFEDLKKKYDKTQFNLYIMELWKQYRHCIFSAGWNLFIESENTQEYFDTCEKAGIKLTKKEKQKYIEASKEEAKHTLDTLNNIVSTNYCIYHDIMPFVIDNEVILGRAFVLEETNYIYSVFAWDLLHILLEAAPLPHVCARCGQLYLSNNNKAKYCSDCKADSNKIRNEKRRSNSCRYLHKKILDKLSYTWNNYKVDKDTFRIESNYYWAIVQNKTPSQIPEKYDKKIKTEKQYMKWLENYLK